MLDGRAVTMVGITSMPLAVGNEVATTMRRWCFSFRRKQCKAGSGFAREIDGVYRAAETCFIVGRAGLQSGAGFEFVGDEPGFGAEDEAGGSRDSACAKSSDGTAPGRCNAQRGYALERFLHDGFRARSTPS